MNILEEANQYTSKDRQAVYGHPIDDFTKVARLAEPILESDLDPRLKHALYMIQVKVARLLKTPNHRDSIVDIAGYANTYGMVLEKLEESKEENNGKTRVSSNSKK